MSAALGLRLRTLPGVDDYRLGVRASHDTTPWPVRSLGGD